MLGKKYQFLFISLLLVGGFYLLNPQLVEAGSDDNLSGWAYSSNIGWVSFNATNCAVPGTCDEGNCFSVGPTNHPGCPPPGGYANYGVNVNPDTGKFSGYAWSSHIGYITFNESELIGCPLGTCRAEIEEPPSNCSSGCSVLGWARACSVFLDPDACSGALNPNRGDWDGWIKLNGSVQGGGWYGVTLESDNEFHGYAWGGDPDGVAENSVIGWLSWNCAEGSQTGGNICPPVGNTDYKVVYNPSNEKPNPPNSLGETCDYCAFGKTPQVATNTTIILSWSSFSDPDDGDTQAAYEIWLDNDSGFPGSRFNYIADGSSSNESALNLIYDKEGDWLSGLNWGTTYYWKVRVKDDKGIWSDFSNFESFTMPSHAYPEPAFSWSPDPPAVDEDVQFSNGTIFSDVICQNNPDNSSCGYYWTFANANKPDSTQREPIIKFISMGDSKVILKSTDSSGYFCEKYETVSSKPPKPEWKEISPSGHLLNGVKNVVANISNFFNKIFSI